MTSDEFLDLKELPASVVVIGGGVIGCEFASLLADLGSKVTILEALDTILPGCDDDIIRLVARSFKKRGIDIVTGVKVEGHTPSERRHDDDGQGGRADLRRRRPSSCRWAGAPAPRGWWRTGVGVEIDRRGFVATDEYQRTGVRRRVGRRRHRGRDPAAGPRGLRRGHRGREGMLGEPAVPVDNAKVPWAIYCHPEVAFCGMTEAQAKEAGIPVVTKKDPFGGNSRAQIIGDTEGVVKVVAEQQPDGSAGRILGVHLCGPWVTEQLGAGYLAVNWEALPDEVAHFIQPHPSLSETFGETMLALTGRGLHLG